MRLAVISDIHGNLEAFKEVLADMDKMDIDECICLGDSIGYGPEPDEVVSLVRSRHIPSVMGNHELGLADRNTLMQFNPFAARALLRTRELLSKETLDYISCLPVNIAWENYLFVHGCPPDLISTYLFELSQRELNNIFFAFEQKICFVGHTHIPELISFSEGIAQEDSLAQGLTSLDKNARYIVNPGSVGQPRDRDNHAKYVIWDEETWTLDLRLISYDIRKTAEKIISLGFDRGFADRLW